MSEGDAIRGIKNRVYRLGKEISSEVFLINGEPYIARLYQRPNSVLEQKLLYMVRNPVPPMRDSLGVTRLRLGWPNDVLYDIEGKFVGYRMRYIHGGIEITEIACGCTSPKAKNMFPDYTWRLNVIVACNLAAAVHFLHDRGCVIGDMDCRNILVMRDGSISILNTDSFCLKDRKNGKHYYCGSGMEDYLAPELQGRNLQEAGAVFGVSTDNFALAIHIFQLLMHNYHPFCVCRITDTERLQDTDSWEDDFETFYYMQQIKSGICPYINRYLGLDIPEGAPMIDEILPGYIKEDFIHTFDYDARHALQKAESRTSAEEWERDLNRLLKECEKEGGLLKCSRNPEHYYLHSKGRCGLCAADNRLAKLVTSKSPPIPQDSVSPKSLKPKKSPKSPSPIVLFVLSFLILVVAALIVFVCMRPV